MRALIRSYTEPGYKPIPHVRLSDDEYAKGLQRFVPACTDIVPIDPRRRKIYLAPRQSKPMTGLWWIGGSMQPNQTLEEAALAAFKRETKLDLTVNRLRLIAVLNYRWKDREQQPQNIGCHMVGYTYVVELTEVELASVSGNMDTAEYKAGAGLTAFGREELVAAGVFQSVLDLYDAVFPPVEAVECGPLQVAADDARRTISERNVGEGAFQDFMIKDASKPLGNHFHRNKFEIFYFLGGGGVIQTAEVNGEGKIIGEIKRFEVGSGSVIKIPAYHTHRFDLTPNTRFVAYSSAPFDATDMISCPIADPEHAAAA